MPGWSFWPPPGWPLGYRNFSHLKAPRYASVLLLQPVLPLLAAPSLHSAVGWATTLAAIALQDLVLALVLRARPDDEAYLEDAAWVLHGAAVVGAVAARPVPWRPRTPSTPHLPVPRRYSSPAPSGWPAA